MGQGAIRLLEDMRVIDLTDEKAAFCGRLLADLGAQIIRVQCAGADCIGDRSTFSPDQVRRRCSPAGDYLQGGICSEFLDLREPEHMSRLLDWIAGADVLIESFAAGFLDGIGLGYETLQAANPGIILASVSGFGQTGPRRNDLACDLIAAATGGQAYVSGAPTQAPQALYGEQTYNLAALFTAVGILTALQGRRHTGCGRHIDISLQEVALASLDHVMVRYFDEGIVAVRRGARHWDGLFALLPCSDGLIHLTPTLRWENLVDWLDSEGMAADLKSVHYLDDDFRKNHMDHILDVLAGWTRTHSVGELFERGQQMGFAWAPVSSPEQVIASPHLKSRDFWRPGRGSAAGVLTPGAPFRLSGPAEKGRHEAWAGEAQHPRPGAGIDACPLIGLRVLDFTRVVAGPFATRMLADFGAQVIKVQTRKGAVGAEDNLRPYFCRWNSNKLSITLDMNFAEARSLALDLAAVSDVVIDNFAPRVMANWQMDYERLQRIKPDLIMLGMSAMGRSGPWRDFTAFAPTIHSLTGHSFLNGGNAVEKGQLGFAFADVVAGLYGALAVLAALEHRRRTGQGRFIDLSEYEAACTLLEPVLLATQLGQTPIPGNPYAEIPAAPYGCYPCLGHERWCAIAVFDDMQWQALIRVMDRPAWMQAKRFNSLAARKRHAAVLDRLIGRWTSGRTAERLAEHLQQAGVPAGVVQSAADLARDPHLAARGVFCALDHPVLGTIPAERNPVHFLNQPPPPLRPAPLLGEHNELVFKELLGIPDEVYEDYCALGIIG